MDSGISKASLVLWDCGVRMGKLEPAGRSVGAPVLGKRSSVESPGKERRPRRKLYERSRGVDGRNTGAQPPLTKRQLKRQRLAEVQERRRCMAAIKEVDRLDLGRINQQLHDLVATDGDIEVPSLSLVVRACRVDRLDLGSINQQLHDLVATDGDIEVPSLWLVSS